jgi:hypothetical protein
MASLRQGMTGATVRRLQSLLNASKVVHWPWSPMVASADHWNIQG